MTHRDARGRFTPRAETRPINRDHADIARMVLAELPAPKEEWNPAGPDIPMRAWFALLAAGATVGIGLGLLAAPFFERLAGA